MKLALLSLQLLAFSLCVLPLVSARKSVLSHRRGTPLAESNTHQYPTTTCKVLLSVCTNDKECCSGNCVLFVCALPTVSEKDSYVAALTDDALAVEESNTHQYTTTACKVLLSVCTNDKECCSGNCVLFVCALPTVSEKDSYVAALTDDALAVEESNTHQYPTTTCKVLLSVCTNDKECCSGNCVLFVCALPTVSEDSYVAALKETTDDALAVPEIKASCRIIGAVCASNKECCSGNCHFLICALAVAGSRKESPNNALTPAEMKASCKIFGAICSSSKECCSGSCLFLICALPVAANELKETPSNVLALPGFAST